MLSHEGGIYDVYQVRKLPGFSEFVVKIENDKSSQGGLDHEIKLLRMLNHENIIKLQEQSLMTLDNRDCLVIEYMNRSLPDCVVSHKISKKTLSDEFIKKIMKCLLTGIEYCHQKDIVHCDIKPPNIVLNSKITKIIDFEGSILLDRTKNLVIKPDSHGTREFYSPELLKGMTIISNDNEAFDRLKKTDLWSVGCVLAYMINERYPFETLKNQNELTEHIDSIDINNNKYKSLLSKLIQYNPKDRPTATEALKIIDEI